MIEIPLPEWLEDDSAIIIASQVEAATTDTDLTLLPSEVEEQVIVNDLLFCLVGAVGSYIKPNQSGSYAIACRMHDSISSFVNQVLPVCDDYAIIRKYSEGHFAFVHGRVIHALCAAIRTVSSEYLQLISKLEAHRRLTLPLLIANIQSPGELLRVLSSLIVQINDKRGCQVISVIHTFLSSFRGSQQLRKLLLYLFQAATAPLLAFVERWIYNGVVDDPFEEFFIRVNDTITPELLEGDYEKEFWDHKYELVERRLPRVAFLSKQAIEHILRAGKSIAVLTMCGLKMPQAPKLSLDSLQRETTLDSASLNASLYLATALRDRYDLMKYLRAFHAIFLFGRGDWFSNFIKLANQIMKNDVEHVHLPALDASLVASLPPEYKEYFIASMDNERILEQVTQVHSVGRKNPSGKSGKSGSSKISWDYFDVTAKIEWPISLVFTSTIQTKYQMIFKTLALWQLIEHKLSKRWKKSTQVREFDHYCHSMQLFATGFIGYTATLVISPSWNELNEGIQSAISIEKIFKIHEESLDKVLNGLFLLDKKVFELLIYISQICRIFVNELKKWSKMVSMQELVNDVDKRNLGAPLIKLYNGFKNAVKDLIKKLNDKGPTIFKDFTNWINVNEIYSI